MLKPNRTEHRVSLVPSCIRLLVMVAAVAGPSSRAIAAFSIVSATNNARDYGYFTYVVNNNLYEYQPYNNNFTNYAINGSAVAYNVFNNQPWYPYLYSYGSGENSTDFSSWIYAGGYAESYSNPTSTYGYSSRNEAWGNSSVVFNVTELSTATLALQVLAQTDNPGVGGSNYAAAAARLLNLTTNTYFANWSAVSQNGSPVQNFSGSGSITLTPGTYSLQYESAYTFGFSYSANWVGGGSDNYQLARAYARLTNIQAVVPEPGPDVVPEPASLAVWALIGLTTGGGALLRLPTRLRRRNG